MTTPEPTTPGPGDTDIGHVMSETQWAAVQAARDAHLASLESAK